jgi:nicotinamide riboside transporter PnuC
MITLQWIATILTLIGVGLNVKKNRWCFAIWLVGNIMWVIIQVSAGIWGMALCQVVFCGTCIWGWVAWSKE